jgi:hypothetical protein
MKHFFRLGTTTPSSTGARPVNGEATPRIALPPPKLSGGMRPHATAQRVNPIAVQEGGSHLSARNQLQSLDLCPRITRQAP